MLVLGSASAPPTISPRLARPAIVATYPRLNMSSSLFSPRSLRAFERFPTIQHTRRQCSPSFADRLTIGFENLARAGGEKFEIGRRQQHAHATRDKIALLGRFGVYAEADGHAGSLRARDDLIERAFVGRMLVLAKQAGGAGEIIRPDRHRVDAGHGEEFVENVERRDILDLRNDEESLVGDRDIIVEIAIIIGGAARTKPAPALRGIAARAHKLPAFRD